MVDRLVTILFGAAKVWTSSEKEGVVGQKAEIPVYLWLCQPVVNNAKKTI